MRKLLGQVGRELVTAAAEGHRGLETGRGKKTNGSNMEAPPLFLPPPKLMAMGHCSRPSCFPGRRLLCMPGFLVAKPGDPLWVPRVMMKAAVAHGAPRPLQSDWSWPPLQSRFSQPDFLLGQLEACPEIDHKS